MFQSDHSFFEQPFFLVSADGWERGNGVVWGNNLAHWKILKFILLSPLYKVFIFTVYLRFIIAKRLMLQGKVSRTLHN